MRGYAYFPERGENIGNAHAKQLLCPTLPSHFKIAKILEFTLVVTCVALKTKIRESAKRVGLGH